MCDAFGWDYLQNSRCNFRTQSDQTTYFFKDPIFKQTFEKFNKMI